MDVPTRTGRGIAELLASAGGVLILLLALVAFDDRLRALVGMNGGARVSDLTEVGQQVNDAALVVALLLTQFVREQAYAHAHLLGFSAVAIVLVIFLLRL